MAPSLTADAQISAQAGKTAQTVVSANPLIFLAADTFNAFNGVSLQSAGL